MVLNNFSKKGKQKLTDYNEKLTDSNRGDLIKQMHVAFELPIFMVKQRKV